LASWQSVCNRLNDVEAPALNQAADNAPQKSVKIEGNAWTQKIDKNALCSRRFAGTFSANLAATQCNRL